MSDMLNGAASRISAMAQTHRRLADELLRMPHSLRASTDKIVGSVLLWTVT